MKLKFSRQTFEKSSNINIHQNPSSGRRVGPGGLKDGRTDRHDEIKNRFGNFAHAPKNEDRFAKLLQQGQSAHINRLRPVNMVNMKASHLLTMWHLGLILSGLTVLPQGFRH